ncbi:MAG: class I SAM-dependent methyltransferase [Actinomycetota bacterium]|nr:class I SAM-dependent methyltransferase [Actinomycetota bacterium]
MTVTPEQARTATNRHYEQAPEYFAAFLDTRMKYSSGLYTDIAMSLEDAQTAKLHFVARSLGVTQGGRLLDIGCGWGSLILFMAAEYGVQVTGVTPSEPQAEFIARRAESLGVSHLVGTRLGSFTSIDVGGGYDYATMLGSIVHMPDRRAALTKTYRALNQGGRLYLSESCFRNESFYTEFNSRPGTKHVTENIFGFADMVPLSTLVSGAEDAGFSLVDLTDLTAHYHRTIEEWERRAVANADEIERIAPGSVEPLVRYLQTANAGWGYTTKHYAITAERSRLGPEVPRA